MRGEIYKNLFLSKLLKFRLFIGLALLFIYTLFSGKAPLYGHLAVCNVPLCQDTETRNIR